MAWYYSDNNQQVGPVDDSAFNLLVSAGKITPETLVWREGMAMWLSHGQVASVPASASAVTVEGGMRCSECGGTFPADDMVQIGNSMVCAACKPIAVQKLKEGVQIPGTFRYAGFWIRVAAKIVDTIILMVVNVTINIAVMTATRLAAGSQSHEMAALMSGVLLVLEMAVGCGYETWFIGKFGATPGKMACGIRVIRPDGEPVGYARACGRYFGVILSGMIIYIGYIMVAFDDEKRALHDRICDTRVVYK